MCKRELRRGAVLVVPLIAAGLLILTGCPEETPKATKPHAKSQTAAQHGEGDEDQGDASDHGHHHAEKGPHGGALVAIGQDDAHLEIMLDGQTGKLTAYVLDGEAEKAISIKQANFQLALSPRSAGEEQDDQEELPESTILLMLAAVSPA